MMDGNGEGRQGRGLPVRLYAELIRKLSRLKPVPGRSPTEQVAELAAELAAKHAALEGNGEAPPRARDGSP
jgi:hypothetical protein